MRLRIRHKLHQQFDEDVRNVTRILRLTPRSHEGQHVISWRLDVDVDCVLKAGEDGFGNITHSFTAKGPCEALTISVAGEVDNFDAVGVVRGSAERLPPELYLRSTPLTQADETLRAFAKDAAAGAQSRVGSMHALQDALHAAMRFDPEQEDAEDAPAAFARQSGSGRDFAHVMAACARHLGIPARVTSGYYLCEDKLRGLRHAWCEAHIEGLGWTGFDAAHRVCPQERHVRLATGLDYLAAAAIRGIGGHTTETLDISAPFTLNWSQTQSQWQGGAGQGQQQGPAQQQGQVQSQGGQSQSQGRAK